MNLFMNLASPVRTSILVAAVCGWFAPAPMFAEDGLATRLAKWKPFDIASPNGLTTREEALVKKLVEAAKHLEAIYWKQSDPEGLKLYRSLACKRERAEELRKLLMVHGARFDLLDHNRTFVGGGEQPVGKGLYAAGITQEQLERYAVEHPTQKARLYSPYTIVKRNGDRLQTMPYHKVYKKHLQPAAKALREAASWSDDPKFAAFLRLRADALVTDRYRKSDFAWLELEDPKFDIVFGPYEVYLDHILGVKTAYGAVIGMRNAAETEKLRSYQLHIAEIQESLPLAAEDKPSKRGLRAPMEVMDTLYRAGEIRHGYVAVATNLPNDPEVHQLKGSKRIFFKDFIDARLQHVLLPLAQRFLRPDWAAKANSDAYSAVLVMHEIGHGIGPTFARVQGKHITIPEALGPIYAALEESKATVVGLYGLAWMAERGILSSKQLDQYYASALAGTFRAVRFGTAEAHGRAQLMEFNYLREHGALKSNAEGLLFVDMERMPAVIAQLAKELLEIEASGDRQRAEALFARFGTMPPDFKAAFNSASDIPVDVTLVKQPFPEFVDEGLPACK
jgi:hypothetical protein